MAAECSNREDVSDHFSQLLHSPLLPEGLGRSASEALMAALSHSLAQMQPQVQLTDEQCQSWRVFIHCGVQCLSALLPADENGWNSMAYLLDHPFIGLSILQLLP